MPPLKTVRHRAALVMLLLAALVATLPGLTIASQAPDTLPTLRRPDGDDDSDDGDSDKAEDADSDKTEDDSDADSDADSDKDDSDKVDEDELPDNVKAILKKNRDAARKAEREARKLRRDNARLKKGEKPEPKPKADDKDDDGDDTPKGPDAGTLKLRQVNLRSALEKKGYPGPRAAAVARLLDDVEFDEKDKPLDLDDALEDAIEEYGDEIAGKGEKPKPKRRRTNTNGRDGTKDRKGPQLTAEELEAAEKAGKTPEQWVAWKGVKNINDALKLVAAGKKKADGD